MRAAFLVCRTFGILFIITGCSIHAGNPATYPYPSTLITEALSPYPYPSLDTTKLPQNTKILSTQTDMTPVPVSKETLARAKRNFEPFLQEFPYVNIADVYPINYYGCINSQNAGGMIDYTVITQTSEDIRNTLTEYFDRQKLKHTDWEELDISGFLGYAWQISASYHPSNSDDALVAIHIGLLEYSVRTTPQSPEVTSTEVLGIPKSHLRLWINYIETPGQFKGYLEPDLLKTCEGGWWLAQNP